MSGPKVIRIVTREEVIAICEGLLARLDQAIARWTQIGRRNGVITERDLAAVEARRDKLRKLLAEDRFTAVQKQAAAEMDFLRLDLDERLARAVETAAETRRARRRVAATAETLLDALKREGRTVPNEIRRRLEQVAAGDGEEAESVIAQAFGLLAAEASSQGESARARKIAEELGAGGEVVSFAEWLSRQPQPAEDEASRRVDRHIAELEAFAGREAAAAFVERAATVRRETSPSRRSLMADSLALDLAAAVRAVREREKVLASLAEERAELERCDGAAELIAEIDAALAAKDAARARELGERAATFIAAERQALAAAARREAVLKGLASLGYEVREGMATAWASGGRLVLRKAAAPDCGVEIGGAGERMQLRPVRFGTEHDASRDRDIETIWCSDFERLVAAAGGSMIVERVTPVGVVPVKTIAGEETAEAGHMQIMKLR